MEQIIIPIIAAIAALVAGLFVGKNTAKTEDSKTLELAEKEADQKLKLAKSEAQQLISSAKMEAESAKMKAEAELKDRNMQAKEEALKIKAGAERAKSDAEKEANKIRASLQLEKVSDTLAWLEENFLDPDQWEQGLKQRILRQKLAHNIFDSEIDTYFAQNHLDFDRFILYQLIVPYEKLAQELFYQVEEEEISFYQAVHLYDVDRQRRYVCGYEGEVGRWDYAPDITAAIFKTPIQTGELVGPVKSPKGYHLFRIEEYIPAQLTPKIRQEIVDQLFKEWLARELNHLIHNQEIPLRR